MSRNKHALDITFVLDKYVLDVRRIITHRILMTVVMVDVIIFLVESLQARELLIFTANKLRVGTIFQVMFSNLKPNWKFAMRLNASGRATQHKK